MKYLLPIKWALTRSKCGSSFTSVINFFIKILDVICYVEAISFHYDLMVLYPLPRVISMVHQDFGRSCRPGSLWWKKCNREGRRESEVKWCKLLFKIQCEDRQEAPAVSGWDTWWRPSGLSSPPSSSQSSHKIVELESPDSQLRRPQTTHFYQSALHNLISKKF